MQFHHSVIITFNQRDTAMRAIKSTYRNFVRKPATNLINLLGLAVSLALVIILSVYSYSELTTDNYHKNGDRLYLFADLNGRMYMPAILKDQIDLNIPEVESTVRLAGGWEAPVFQAGDRDPITSDMVFADVDFFKLFTYQAAEGNLETALKEPMTVVLTKPLAEKIFGKEPALGKTIKLNSDKELTVSAVIYEPEANTSLSFSAITSTATRKIVQPNGEEFTNWGWSNFQLFVLLKEGVLAGETAKKIGALFPKNDQEKEDYSKLKLNSFDKVYFARFSLFGNGYLRSGDKRKVMILVMVAALVLMIALVNFINISSSQWMEKIRQTGVMKVIGARRSTILKQILSESFLLFLLALVLSMVIVNIVSPVIKNNTGIQFSQHLLFTPSFLLVSIAGTFLLSLAFSIVPALRISSSKAVDNLKKAIEPGGTKSIFKGILVTSQFVIAIVLIAFTVLVQKQVNFGSSNMGFNQDNVIGIKLTQQLNGKRDVLKKMLQEKPSVGKVSFTQYYPGKQLSHWTSNQNVNGVNKQYGFDTFNADADFFGIFGLQLVQGRLFSEDLATDQHTMVVNETFVREHKMDNPVGSKFVMGMDGHLSEIIGVVKDFHYKAVTEPIVPLLIQNEPYASICLVSLQTADFNTLHKTIQDVKAATAVLSPSFPVEITFFDQAIENMYQSELQFRRTFSLFAICAIVICCLGILAMSLFACQRRIKEIGVRKVNGARISEVMVMLNRDFVKWVAIAFVIATPIAYIAMLKWLENFAYKTELSWWIFALAGLLALGIALLTVSWQSWRAATRNPVEALRYE
jgi:putative ABC transport system permease protein